MPPGCPSVSHTHLRTARDGGAGRARGCGRAARPWRPRSPQEFKPGRAATVGRVCACAGARRRQRAHGAGAGAGGVGGRGRSRPACFPPFVPRAVLYLAPPSLREGVGRHYGGSEAPRERRLRERRSAVPSIPSFLSSLPLPHPVIWVLEARRSRGLSRSVRRCR